MEFFDPNQSFDVTFRRLPHWSQPGVITFITWRTCDSMPESAVGQWLAERDRWLTQHGIDPLSPDPQAQVVRLGNGLALEFKKLLANCWNDQLDASHGECLLRRSEFSRSVADSLLHFDHDRYLLTDFVVMPNHVHVMAAFQQSADMLKQCESWKRYTGNEINRRLGRKGRFWQQDDFDHLVRSPEQFEYLRTYIANNPKKAKLAPGQYYLYSSRAKR